MSRSHECPACEGQGQTIHLGTGTYGPIYAGSCAKCGGTGLLLDLGLPKPATRYEGAPRNYFNTPEEAAASLEEYRRQCAEDAAAEADRLDWIEQHAHYL